MNTVYVRGGNQLQGSIRVHGAKNAVLPILAATVLTGGEYRIGNCPNLSDVCVTLEILTSLGCCVRQENDSVFVDSSCCNTSEITQELMQKLRSSVVFMGALLSRHGHVCITAPGGCEIGQRPIDIHISALKQLGACVEEKQGKIYVSASSLTGCPVHLSFPSVGATENAILAAVGAAGVTTVINAACEPEIEDLVYFLQKMGAEIYGAGTKTITVHGGKPLHAAVYNVMPDRICAATYLCAGAICGGCVSVQGVRPDHLYAVTRVLAQCGCAIHEQADLVTVCTTGRLKAAEPIVTMPYPGFPTDVQSQMMAVLSTADGTSVMKETLFENRFKIVPELNRMGADITVDGRIAVVIGKKQLCGAPLYARDLRGGAALVLAALAARGESVVFGGEYICRGYMHFIENLNALGAEVFSD